MLALVAVAPRVCRPLPLHPILPGVRAPKLGRGLSQVPLRWVLQPQTFLAVGRGPGSGGWLGVGVGQQLPSGNSWSVTFSSPPPPCQ